MLIRCSTCSAVYSKDSSTKEGEGYFTCSCGELLPLPEQPKESAFWRWRNRIKESLACGLIFGLLVAAAAGGIPVGLPGSRWIFKVSVGFALGFIVGAIWGERVLDWF